MGFSDSARKNRGLPLRSGNGYCIMYFLNGKLLKGGSGMDNRPIGVFDSGLGGLTAVKALRQILPEEKLIYFGDTARVPYGGRSKETLLKYARQDVRFLRSFDLKAIVIACGTVSTTSLDTLQAENDLPIVGVVEPTCRRALLVTKNKKVGIIATLASIRSGAYEAMLRRLDPAVEIIGKPCPLFVPAGGKRPDQPGRCGDRNGGQGISGAAEGYRGGHPDPGLHPLPAADGDHR